MNQATIAIIDSLGWTLLHFVWQGAVAGVLLWLFSRLLPSSPRVRYAAGCLALASMTAAAAVTFAVQWSASPSGSDGRTRGDRVSAVAEAASRNADASGEIRDDIERPAVARPSSADDRSESARAVTSTASTVRSWPSRARSALRPWLSWIVGLWALGVGLLGVRLSGSWRAAAKLRSSGREPDDASWRDLFERLRRRLRVTPAARLLISGSAQLPMVVGWLRPVVIVPASMLTGLSRSQVEAVLAHELAHVRRHDYLVNLLQNVVETLFFYHPAVWWVSREVRRQREYCCDDVAATVRGDTLDYAKALLALEGLRRLPNTTQVAATGGSLVCRIRRLVGRPTRREPANGWTVLAAVGVVAAALLFVSIQSSPAAAGRQSPASPRTEDTDTGGEEAVVVNVLDREGNKAIEEFRVLAGTRTGSVSAEFEKRTGKEVVNWQPHTIRVGRDGKLVWPLRRAYQEFALRVEATGYRPQVFAWIKKADGPKNLIFGLSKDEGTSGRVLGPDGQPAAGALIALGLPQKDVVIEKGKIRGADLPRPAKESDRWRRPTIVRADGDGRFRLPAESEGAAVVVAVHESGVLEVPHDRFAQDPVLKLDRWGRIEGRILWKDKPGVDEPVGLIVHRDRYGYPGMVASYADTRSDAEGRFDFEKVLPGQVQIARYITTTDPESGTTQAVLPGMVVHPDVAAGEVTRVQIGGRGRVLKGRLVGRESWDDVTFHFHPTAPHIGFPGDDMQWKAFGKFRESDIGPLYFRDALKPNPDGTFEIPDVFPGSYQLFVSAKGVDNYAASLQFRVDAEQWGRAPELMDLGPIRLAAGREKEDSDVNETDEKNDRGDQDDASGAADSKGDEDDPAAKQDPPADPQPSMPVRIRGMAIDDESGQPVSPLIVQAGKFDPADPKKVTWGYSESRSSRRDGSFSATVRWWDGWTARVLADGYLPAPVLTEPPLLGADSIEVTLRLKRGRLARGTVIDHQGKPVAGAAVFAVGPTGLNLHGGQAWKSYGGPDEAAKPVTTDADGRFELPTGDAEKLAVSCSTIDAWVARLPDQGEVTVQLPEPARIDVRYDIEGGEAKSTVFYQLLSHEMPLFKGVESSRDLPIDNGGSLSLTALPPGKYQICRQTRHRLGDMGFGSMLDREFLELKPGERRTIDYTRPKGAIVFGRVLVPDGVTLSGMIVSVRGEKEWKDPFQGSSWHTKYASCTVADDGGYRTERIPPGRFVLKVEAYVPLTEQQRFRTGVVGPAYRAETTIEVPESGELPVPELRLKKVIGK